MKLSQLQVVSCGVLVIGGGGAGLRAAIAAREKGADVLLVSKARAGYANNTMISKATFAAPSGWADPRDNPEVFLKDTVMGGRFVNDQRLVAAVAGEAGAQMTFLEKCGVKFFESEGRIMAIHAAGHSYARHIRARERKGSGLVLPLKEYARENGVRFADSVFITRLLTSEGGRIAAAAGITRDGEFIAFVSKCFVLATGGFAQIFLHTNNAPGITGDGLALAFELGAPIKDMEFVQFYPTAAGKLGNRLILYENLILRDRAVLKNADGDDIVIKQGLNDAMKMTRDRLARVIMQEVFAGRGVEDGVLMDLSRASEAQLLKYRSLLKDPHKKAFIVAPTTHFCSGGVMINANGQTPIDGLFAAGEICAGVHGANRLAGRKTKLYCNRYPYPWTSFPLSLSLRRSSNNIRIRLLPAIGQFLNRSGFGHGLQGRQCIQNDAPLAFDVARFTEHAAARKLDQQGPRRLDMRHAVGGIAHGDGPQTGFLGHALNQTHGLMAFGSDRQQKKDIDP